MTYRKTVQTDRPELLSNLQPGQWIDYEGCQGRFMGRRNGTIWIAWGVSARKRFAKFARAYRS